MRVLPILTFSTKRIYGLPTSSRPLCMGMIDDSGNDSPFFLTPPSICSIPLFFCFFKAQTSPYPFHNLYRLQTNCNHLPNQPDNVLRIVCTVVLTHHLTAATTTVIVAGDLPAVSKSLI